MEAMAMQDISPEGKQIDSSVLYAPCLPQLGALNLCYLDFQISQIRHQQLWLHVTTQGTYNTHNNWTVPKFLWLETSSQLSQARGVHMHSALAFQAE